MNKLALLGLPVLALMGLTACNEDTDPKIDTSTEFEFVLNTPQMATQFIDLSTNGTMDFTVSQPNYGITVAPTYGLEISLSPDFEPVVEEPVIDEEGEEHIVPGVYVLNLESQLKGVLVVKMSDMAAGINELNGVYDESSYTGDYVGPVYVRATAYLGSGVAAEKTAVTSNTVILSEVQGYASFPAEVEVALSVPGVANGWTHPTQLIFVEEKGKALIFKGFAVVDQGFKITDGDWDGSGNWGTGDSSLIDNGDGTYSATLVQNGGDFNKDGADGVPAGLYYFEVSITDLTNGTDGAEVGTMKMTQITSITLPGDYNGWDVNSNELSNDGDYTTWTVTAPVNANGWKFAFNHDWAINLGGDIENLSFDGGDIKMEGSTITLHIGQYPWTCTVE